MDPTLTQEERRRQAIEQHADQIHLQLFPEPGRRNVAERAHDADARVVDQRRKRLAAEFLLYLASRRADCGLIGDVKPERTKMRSELRS